MLKSTPPARMPDMNISAACAGGDPGGRVGESAGERAARNLPALLQLFESCVEALAATAEADTLLQQQPPQSLSGLPASCALPSLPPKLLTWQTIPLLQLLSAGVFWCACEARGGQLVRLSGSMTGSPVGR